MHCSKQLYAFSVEHDVMSSDEGVTLKELRTGPESLREPVQLISQPCPRGHMHAAGYSVINKDKLVAVAVVLSAPIPLGRILGNKAFLFPHVPQTWYIIIFFIQELMFKSNRSGWKPSFHPEKNS